MAPRFLEMEVTDRDENLLRYLHSVKLATTAQVNRDIFGGIDKGPLSRRLSRLSQFDLIKPVYERFGGSHLSYEITARGLKVLFGKVEDVDLGKKKSEKPKHDLVLNDIRWAFKRFCNVQWYYTENEIQSGVFPSETPMRAFRRIHCDAALGIAENETLLSTALECELSVKAIERYEEKLASYYANSEIDGVIYIVKEDSQKKIISEIDERVRSKDYSKLFMTTLEKVLSNPTELTFRNSTEYVFSLNCTKNVLNPRVATALATTPATRRQPVARAKK